MNENVEQAVKDVYGYWPEAPDTFENEISRAMVVGANDAPQYIAGRLKAHNSGISTKLMAALKDNYTPYIWVELQRSVLVIYGCLIKDAPKPKKAKPPVDVEPEVEEPEVE